MLDTMSGWGVNGSLVTLLPDQPLPLLSLPPPSASSSGSLSSGAVAGIVMGSCVGTALLAGVGVLLLLCLRCVLLLPATADCEVHAATATGRILGGGVTDVTSLYQTLRFLGPYTWTIQRTIYVTQAI